MADLYLYVTRQRVDVTRASRFLKGQEKATFLEHLPSTWIGRASWKKAALFGETEPYVPLALLAIEKIVGAALPVIDEELIERIRHAMQHRNTTPYPLAHPDDVVTFLDNNRGQCVFLVRWN